MVDHGDSRPVRVLLGGAVRLALAMPGPCALIGCGAGFDEVDDAAQTDTFEHGVSEESTDDGATGMLEPVVSPSCAADDRIEGMPFAYAWRDTDEGGRDVFRVAILSYPGGCATNDTASAPTAGSQIMLRVPAGLAWSDAVNLRDLQAHAVMQEGAPGNDGTVAELAFLWGSARFEVADGVLVGDLEDTNVPFVGCFAATLCASKTGLTAARSARQRQRLGRRR